jgi:hypothetical protein
MSNIGEKTKTSKGAKAHKLTEAAQKYRSNHHWVPLRLQGKSPDCMGKGWNERTLQDAVPEYKDRDNIGFLLGEPSGGVVRLDPDFPSVPEITDLLFPEPTAIFGRKSAPRTGRLFVCKGLNTKNFVLPKAMKDDKRLPLHNGEPSLVVYQILSTGSQTMAPPSVHPETGEEVVWQSEQSPTELEADELLRRVGIEAFLMVVIHFWPALGTRNEAAIALSRVLLEAFENQIANDEELITLVDDIIGLVAMTGGDGEASLKGKKRAANTLEKLRAGQDTTGLTRLVDLLELPKDVTKIFRSWLKQRSENYMERLNRRHAVVRVGAKTAILDEVPGQPPLFMCIS